MTWAEHGGDRFVAAVENGPLSATQFHPEKSGDAGARLLRNWVVGLVRGSRRARRRGHEQGARPAPRGTRAGGRHRRGCAGAEAEKRERRTRAQPGRDVAVAPAALAPDRACWPQRRRRRLGVIVAVLVALNVLVWVIFPDWPPAA